MPVIECSVSSPAAYPCRVENWGYLEYIYKAEGHSITGAANNRQLRLKRKAWALISPETRGYFPLINNRPQEIYSNGFVFGWQMYAVYYQWRAHTGLLMQLELLVNTFIFKYARLCFVATPWTCIARDRKRCRRGGLCGFREFVAPARTEGFGVLHFMLAPHHRQTLGVFHGIPARIVTEKANKSNLS